MLKSREESDTYLTHVCRHNWSRKSLVKIDEISGAFSQHCGFHQLQTYIYQERWLLIFHQFSQGSFCSINVNRRESGRCCSLLFFLIFFIIFLRLLLYLSYFNSISLSRFSKHHINTTLSIYDCIIFLFYKNKFRKVHFYKQTSEIIKLHYNKVVELFHCLLQ